MDTAITFFAAAALICFFLSGISLGYALGYGAGRRDTMNRTAKIVRRITRRDANHASH